MKFLPKMYRVGNQCVDEILVFFLHVISEDLLGIFVAVNLREF